MVFWGLLLGVLVGQVAALEFQRVAGLEESSYSRDKRNTESYFIDVLPVVDYKLYQEWLANNDAAEAETKITKYLTQILASVNQRVGTLQTTQQLVITMVTPYIAKNAESSPYSEVLQQGGSINATELLERFESWLQQATDIPDNDHAMLFTGYELTSTTDSGLNQNFTQGLALVGTVCEGYKSVSVIEDKQAYQSEAVAAHELGHSLGAVHDVNNPCPASDRYIMADNFNYPHTADTRLNPWQFSDCSAQAVQRHLNNLQGDTTKLNNCLKLKTGQDLTTPTALRTPNSICEAFYGPESYTCRGVDIVGIDRVCDQLFCKRPGTDTCVLLTAPTGTCCGNKKACMMGICADVTDDSQCNLDEECPLGDQPGVVYDGLTCQQLSTRLCYNPDIQAKCCSTCRDRKSNKAGCEFGDKAAGCEKNTCGTTDASGVPVKFLCCGTCENVDCTDNALVNGKTCGEFVKERGRSACYDSQVLDVCCVTCEEERTKDRDDCLFGDNLTRINCDILKNSSRQCNEEENSVCCETCPKPTAPPTTAPPVTTAPPDTTAPPPNRPQTTQRCTGSVCSTSSLAQSTIWGAILCVAVATAPFLF